MSAPETNVEKQTRNHKPVLIAIFAVIALAGAAALAFTAWNEEDFSAAMMGATTESAGQ